MIISRTVDNEGTFGGKGQFFHLMLEESGSNGTIFEGEWVSSMVG